MFLLCSRARSAPYVSHACSLRLNAAHQRRAVHVSSVLNEIRRKMSAHTEAQKFRQQLNEPDRIVGRAFAELEEEKRRKLEWKQRMGYLSEKEKKDLENEKAEMVELGMDPSKGRWSAFLKKKRFTPKEKKGMPEFRAGASMQSLLAKVKHAKSLKKKRKHNR